MNCEQFSQALDDYLDGDLPAGSVSALRLHADSCAACQRELHLAQELQRRAFALPPREPARDLWPSIVERLEPRQVQHRRVPWLQAIAASAALVAVFAGGMLANNVLTESGQNDSTLVAEKPAARDRVLPSVTEARRMLPASHVELIEGAGSAQGVQLAAEQDLLRNLMVVNLAIRRVENAVEDDPANANLRELLADLYSRENRILVEAERLRVEQQQPSTRTGI